MEILQAEITLHIGIISVCHTVWKVSTYRVFSGLYFSIFSPNTGKYGPEKTPYLDTFYAVSVSCLLVYLQIFNIVNILFYFEQAFTSIFSRVCFRQKFFLEMYL